MNRVLCSLRPAAPSVALLVSALMLFIGVTGLAPVLAQTQADQPPVDKQPAAAPQPVAEPPAPLPPIDGTPIEDAESGRPRAEVPEPTKDFGEFWAGADVTHSFVIRNTGTETLEILRVKASCGCTSTGYDKRIAPGQEGAVSARLKTKNLNKRFTKTVNVTTNDPKNATIRLKLTGVAKQYVEVQPRTAHFAQVQPDETVKRTVRITNNSAEPMKLTLEREKAGVFTAVLKETDPGKRYELEITGHPPYQPRHNRATFNLKTNISAKPKLSVLCSANVPPRLELRPRSIRLRGAQSKKTKRTVRFINSGKTEVKVTGVTVADPKITASVRERRPGKDYSIEVVFPAGYTPGAKGTRLVVNTDDSETPTMTVPITEVAAARKPRPKPGEKLVGKPAPKMTLQTVEGKAIALGEPTDDILVLEFYASWCGFCKRSLPHVEKIHQKYKDKGVRVIAISEDGRTGKRGRSEEKIAQHFKELNLTMERALDPNKELGRPYFAQSFPTMYLVGRNGKIEALHSGAKPNLVEVVSQDLDQLLAGKSLSAKKAAAKGAAAAKAEKPDEAAKPGAVVSGADAGSAKPRRIQISKTANPSGDD